MSIEVDLKFNSGGASMKLFLLLMFGVLCRGSLLDRGYLPPPGAKTSGGSPGAIDVPLETPLETPKSDVQSRPIQGSFTGRYNVRPEDQSPYATTPSGLDSEAIFPSVQPGSVNLPTTTQTSFAFTQTTTYSPLEDIQCNGPKCGSEYRFSSSVPDKTDGVQPASIPSSSDAPQKTGYKNQPHSNVPASIFPFQPISDFGSTTQSPQAFQPYGSTSQPSQIPGHLQTTIGSEAQRDQTFKPGTGSSNDQILTAGYEPGRDGLRDITSSAQYPTPQENYVNNLPSSSLPQSGQSSLPMSGSEVPANRGYQPGRDLFTPPGQYLATQKNSQNLPIYSASNIPTNVGPPGSQATGPALFAPTTSPNFSNQQTLGTQPLTPSAVSNVPEHSGPLVGFPSTSARDYTSGGPNQYTPSALPPGSVNRPGATAFDPNAPSRFGSIGEAQRFHTPSLESNATILNYDNVITPEGYFSYNFDTSNGIHADEAGDASDGVKAEGSYSYTGDDGQFYRVTYTADENGYQPKGDHLPTPPPIPEAIQRVIEQSIRDQAAGMVPDPGFYDEEKYGYKKYHKKTEKDLPSYQAPNRRGPNQQEGGVERSSQVLSGRKPTNHYGIPSKISPVNDGRVPHIDDSIKQLTLRPSYDNKYRIPDQGISDKVISQKPPKYLPEAKSQNAQKVPFDIQQIPSTVDPYRAPEGSIPRGQSTSVTGSSDQKILNTFPDQSILINELPNLNQSPTTSAPIIYDISRSPSQNVRPSGEEYNQFGHKSSTPTDQNQTDKSYINEIGPSGTDVFGRPSQKIIPLPGTIPQKITSKPYNQFISNIMPGSSSVFAMTRPTQMSTDSKIPEDDSKSFEPIPGQPQDGHDYQNRFSVPVRRPIFHEDNTDSGKPGTTLIPTSAGVLPQRQQTSVTVRPSGESRTPSGYQYNVPAQRLDTEENQNQRYQPRFPSSVRRPNAGGIPESIEGTSTVAPSTFYPTDNAYPSTVGLIGTEVSTEPGSTRKTGRPSPGSIELFNVTPDNLTPIQTVTDYGHPIDGVISTLKPGMTTGGNIKYNQDRLTTITPSQVDSATQRLPLDDNANKQSQGAFPYQYSTSIPSSPGLGQESMVPRGYTTAELGQTQFPGEKYTPRGDDGVTLTYPEIFGTVEPLEPIRSIFDEIGIPKGDSIFKSQPTPGEQSELTSKQPFQSQQIATDGPSRFESTQKPDDQYTYQQNVPQRGSTFEIPQIPGSRPSTLETDTFSQKTSGAFPGSPSIYQQSSTISEYPDSRRPTSRPGYTDGQDFAIGSIDSRQNISRPGFPDTRYTTVKPGYPDAQGTSSRPGYSDIQSTTSRSGYPDTRYTAGRPGYPDSQKTTAKPGSPDAQGTTSRPGYPDTRYTNGRPGYPDAQGTFSRPVYSDIQSTTSRSGYPDTRYTAGRPAYPDSRGTTAKPGYPDAQGTTSKPGYPDTRYTTGRPGYPDSQGTTYKAGSPDAQGTTSRPRYSDTRYSTDRPGYPDSQVTTAKPRYPDAQGTNSRPGYPDTRYTTGRSGYPDSQATTAKPGYPDAQGTTSRPGYPDTRYTTARPGYSDTRYTTTRPAYPDAQSTSSRPVYTDEHGTTVRARYPNDLYTTSGPRYFDERYTTDRPENTYIQGTPSRHGNHDSRYSTSRPRYPDERYTTTRPGYPDKQYTTSKSGHPDVQGTTFRPAYPDPEGTTFRPRYPDEKYTTSRLGYPSAQGISSKPEYPDMRYTTSRPGYPDKSYHPSVPSSVGQTQPQQYQGLDRESTGVPHEERKDHGLFEPMIEQKLQGEVPQTPGQFGSKLSSFPKVKGEVFSPSRQPPRYDPETGYHY